MSEIQKISEIIDLIRNFTESQNEVQGQIVVAYPAGVPIANTWKGDVDPILIGAVSAAVKLTFQSLCQSLKKGNMKRLIVRNENGRCIIQSVGPKAILTTIIDLEADIFNIAFELTNLCIKIENLLRGLTENLENLISNVGFVG